jgi:hypothetical protein
MSSSIFIFSHCAAHRLWLRLKTHSAILFVVVCLLLRLSQCLHYFVYSFSLSYPTMLDVFDFGVPSISTSIRQISLLSHSRTTYAYRLSTFIDN